MIKTTISTESTFNYKNVINLMNFSFKGKYESYEKDIITCTKEDPVFLGRFINFNRIKSEIKDSKVAIPILALRNLHLIENKEIQKELAENAIANLMFLSPRDLVKAYNYNKSLSLSNKVINGGWRKMFVKAINEYLSIREDFKPWWDSCTLTHRAAMKHLYAISHRKPSNYVQRILFDKDYPENSIFWIVKNLHLFSPQEQANLIIAHRIPSIVIFGALGIKKENVNSDLVLALIERMTGQQFISNAKFISSFISKDNTVLRVAYEEAFKRAITDSKVTVAKASKAIDVLKNNFPNVSEKVVSDIEKIQEKKIDNSSIEGDWVVLGDCSSSMNNAVELAKVISAFIARVIKGKVHLIFFNSEPKYFDVTGKTFEEIKEMTKYITATGCTSCGCGLKYLEERNISVNGIALISDGGDNTNPYFHKAYEKYCSNMLIEPSIYMYTLRGEPNFLKAYCRGSEIFLNEFDLTSGKVSLESLPSLVSSMRTSNYSFIDEINQIPFLTLKEVFQTTVEKYGNKNS